MSTTRQFPSPSLSQPQVIPILPSVSRTLTILRFFHQVGSWCVYHLVTGLHIARCSQGSFMSQYVSESLSLLGLKAYNSCSAHYYFDLTYFGYFYSLFICIMRFWMYLPTPQKKLFESLISVFNFVLCKVKIFLSSSVCFLRYHC